MEIRLYPDQPIWSSSPDFGTRRVLIVDDDDLVRETLRLVLEDSQHHVHVASHAAEALAILDQQPIDIILSDIFMPGMNGFELLNQVSRLCPHVPVILFTGFGNIEMARRALKEGAADFITKPYNVHEIPIIIERNLMRRSIEDKRVHDFQEEVQKTYSATMEALLAALDTRDTETEGHSERVAAYTMTIAGQLGLSTDELMHIERGALLHDIGKIGVPDQILYKPGPLTPEEWEIMKQHPVIGYRMCMKVEILRPAAPIVLHHHEWWDGKGYPYGLGGAEIPLGARIFAIADTLDAMTSDRPYRHALPFDKAREEILRCSGSQFDPDLVRVFLEIPETQWENIRQVIMAGRENRAA